MSLQISQGQEFASKTKIDELKTKLSIGDNLKAEVSVLLYVIYEYTYTVPVSYSTVKSEVIMLILCALH